MGLENIGVELRNPPVIEAWIEFRFSVEENAPPWDVSTFADFLEKNFEGQYQIKDLVGHYELTLASREGVPGIKDARAVFERARAASQNGESYLQAGRDVLIYNLLRQQEAWPSYDALRDQALNAYGKYVAYAKPSGLLAVGLHYRDMVNIPFAGKDHIDLERYFKIHPQVPGEIFGPVSRFSIALTIPCMADQASLNLVIQDERQPADAEKRDTDLAKFRMDWHLNSGIMESMEREHVRQWLDKAHSELIRVFSESFTNDAWALFERKEE